MYQASARFDVVILITWILTDTRRSKNIQKNIKFVRKIRPSSAWSSCYMWKHQMLLSYSNTCLNQSYNFLITSFNPLIPESNLHLISPFSITPKSNSKVMRIKEIVINWRTSWLLNKFSLPAHKEMYWEHWLN